MDSGLILSRGVELKIIQQAGSVIAIVNVANVCYCWNVVKTPCAQFNDTCRTFEGKFPLVKDFCF